MNDEDQVWWPGRMFCAGVAVAAVGLALMILAARPALSDLLYLLLPILACSRVLLADDAHRSSRETWAAFAAPAVAVAVAAVPLLCFIAPYLVDHQIGKLITGLFVLPQKRVQFASFEMPSAQWILARAAASGGGDAASRVRSRVARSVVVSPASRYGLLEGSLPSRAFTTSRRTKSSGRPRADSRRYSPSRCAASCCPGTLAMPGAPDAVRLCRRSSRGRRSCRFPSARRSISVTSHRLRSSPAVAVAGHNAVLLVRSSAWRPLCC